MPLTEDERPSAAVRGASAYAEAGPSEGCAFLLATIVALTLLRVPLSVVRWFDNDEFEHAHAAWSLFKGLVPYKDFFEHHTPGYYYFLSPFLRWFPAEQSFETARHFLIFGRLLSLALTASSAGLVYLVARLGAGRRDSLLATLFFVSQPVLVHKTIELRPDVPALTFFIGTLWFLRRGLLAWDGPATRRIRWFVGGGLCLGGAVMCTQKLLFVLPGMMVGLAFWILAGRRRELLARSGVVVLFGLAIAAPALTTWIGLSLRGAGQQFIYNNFILNAHWRMRSDRHLWLVLRTTGPILLLCLVGGWAALVGNGGGERPGRRDSGDVLLLCTLAGLFAGLIVVPAAYEQYYLPALTIACLFAARGLAHLLSASRQRRYRGTVVWATVALLILPAVDLVQTFRRRNDVQMDRLRFVYAHTGPTDPVLDGWLGMNVFRPSPTYYLFMHSELRTMLAPAQIDAYLDRLASPQHRPALIVLDDELRALGPRFMQWLQRNYASSDGLFFLPRPPASAVTPPG